MKLWKCQQCGYIHKGDLAPQICPACGAPQDKFVEVQQITELNVINQQEKMSDDGDVQVNPFFGDYESLVAFVYNLPVGKEVPLHKHPTTDELFHVIKGDIQFRVGDKVINAKPGDIIQGKMDVPHGFKNTGNEPAAFLSVKGPKPVDLVMLEGE